MSSDWEAEITADEVVISVCLNRRLYRDYQQAKEAADQLDGGVANMDTDEVKDALQAVVDAQKAVDEASRTFTFTTVDYDVWQDLIDAHQPTEQQRSENKYLEYNPRSFPTAAVAAACVDPGLTTEQAEKLRQKLPRQEWDRLWGAAWTSNVGGSDIPKSEAAIVRRLATELSSTMRLVKDSPSPSSEDGSTSPTSLTG